MAPSYRKDIDVVDKSEDDHDSSDEDFQPAAAAVDESASSSDEGEAELAPKKARGGRKRKAPVEDALDSGDEVTINIARASRAKKRKGIQAEDDDLILSDDEGGEGGLIKTRAQRRGEQKERRPLAGIEGATVDVEALWAQMLAAPLKPHEQTPAHRGEANKSEHTTAATLPTTFLEDEEQVAIKKVYTFAGQDTTEEKQVPRSLLEKHLADGWKVEDLTVAATISEVKDVVGDSPKIRRPLRRPLRFDPNPTGYVRALPPEHQLSWPRKTTVVPGTDQENAALPRLSAPLRPEKTQKLNVVDKSRLDWTGFVNKEGIADELDTHGKTKEAYLGRMQFLAGVEARKEEERRKVKTAAAAG